MSGLRAPGLGPVIGHTTHNSCRIWIRAGDPEDAGAQLAENRRTLGVIGLLDKNGKVHKAYYFRLQREFDRTGSFILGEDVALGRHERDGIPAAQQDKPYKLTPDTPYAVRVGTLTLDDPLPNDESISDRELAQRLPPVENIRDQLLTLPAECEASFQTFPDPDASAAELAFIIGSCRYPGLLWKIKQADEIFAGVADHVCAPKGPRARFTIMMGDQIYADLLNRAIPILRADNYEEFQQRYHQAYGAPNMRRLLRSAPTYMILDDHEIEDNWTQDRLTQAGKHQLFNVAISAYMSYQWSHGPRTWGRLLYYTFECGGYPYFVIDTRTQRYKDDAEGLKDNHILGRPTIDPAYPSQLSKLLDWMTVQQHTRGNVPKFIVSSSVFAPNSIDERLDPALLPDGVDAADPEQLLFQANRKRREDSDSWPAYPLTRLAILKHILLNKIQNVVFLTGDIHCSNIAKMQFSNPAGASDLTAYDITSSAFYWPFPFADGDPNSYVHDSTQEGQRDGFPILGTGYEMNYRSWGFTQEDNFCRLELDKHKAALAVRVYNRRGEPVQVSDEKGKMTKANVLKLAPWT